MTDDAAFQQMLDEAKPCDRPAIYGVYSDWLQEYGDWRAAGYRWMGENFKTPHKMGPGISPSDIEAWRWCLSRHSGSKHQLSKALWHKLKAHPVYYFWPSRRLAEEQVCRAIHEKRYRPRWRKVVA